MLAILNQLGTAVELGPGRTRLTLDDPTGSTRDVEIVMTPDEWAEMVGVMWGGYGPELREHVTGIVRGLAPHERFLVYADYTLVPSATEKLPVDEEFARLQALAREHPEGIGRWVVEDPDGNVVDELGWHPE